MSADDGLVYVTDRLAVRRLQLGDLAWLEALLGDPVTMQHWPAPLTPEAAAAWLRRALAGYAAHGYARWRVELKQGGLAIGDVGVVRMAVAGAVENDLGYIIDRRHWGHGYGLEAAAGAVAWARARGLASVVASMADDNLASVLVAERLGMALERTFNNPRNADKRTRLYRLRLGS